MTTIQLAFTDFNSPEENTSDNNKRGKVDSKPELERWLDAALIEQIELLPAISPSFLNPLHCSFGPSVLKLTKDLPCESGIWELEYRVPFRTREQGRRVECARAMATTGHDRASLAGWIQEQCCWSGAGVCGETIIMESKGVTKGNKRLSAATLHKRLLRSGMGFGNACRGRLQEASSYRCSIPSHDLGNVSIGRTIFGCDSRDTDVESFKKFVPAIPLCFAHPSCPTSSPPSALSKGFARASLFSETVGYPPRRPTLSNRGYLTSWRE